MGRGKSGCQEMGVARVWIARNLMDPSSYTVVQDFSADVALPPPNHTLTVASLSD